MSILGDCLIYENIVKFHLILDFPLNFGGPQINLEPRYICFELFLEYEEISSFSFVCPVSPARIHFMLFEH